MASKNCMWAILALCGSLLAVAAPAVVQAADPPAEQGAKAKAKQDATTCRYVESPGARLKRRVCGTPAHTDVRMPPSGAALSSPPTEVPGQSGFSNPANQSAYQRYR